MTTSARRERERPIKLPHALRHGEMGRRYIVGTFPADRPSQFRAYLRHYMADWEGCIEYEVVAANGQAAKRAAIAARKALGESKS